MAGEASYSSYMRSFCNIAKTIMPAVKPFPKIRPSDIFESFARYKCEKKIKLDGFDFTLYTEHLSFIQYFTSLFRFLQQRQIINGKGNSI